RRDGGADLEGWNSERLAHAHCDMAGSVVHEVVGETRYIGALQDGARYLHVASDRLRIPDQAGWNRPRIERRLSLAQQRDFRDIDQACHGAGRIDRPDHAYGIA